VTGEKFTPEQLAEAFDLSRVSKGRAMFDSQKLRHINQIHLNDLSLEDLAKLAPARDTKHEAVWKEALGLVRADASTLQDLYRIEKYLDRPDLASSAAAKEHLSGEEAKKILAQGLEL